LHGLKVAVRTVPVLGLCVALVGCGSSSPGPNPTQTAGPVQPQPVGQGVAVARCDRAILGQGDPNWRNDATYVGRVGFFGPERDFGLAHGGRVKTPVFVEGRRAVTLAIDPADRNRAGLEIVGGRHPYATIHFVPCPDHTRTAWPAGFRLRNRDPVVVLVHSANAPDAKLEVGGS
jgi:hypothetical protein